MVVEGEDAVAVSRHIIGKTNPTEADPGTIRGDYGLTVGRNIIHGSDSVESLWKKSIYGLMMMKYIAMKLIEKIGFMKNNFLKVE